jgi:hypothetical protein
MLSQERPAQKAFLFKYLRNWCILASITCVALPNLEQNGPFVPSPSRSVFDGHSACGGSHPAGVYYPRPPQRNDRAVAVRASSTLRVRPSAEAAYRGADRYLIVGPSTRVISQYPLEPGGCSCHKRCRQHSTATLFGREYHGPSLGLSVAVIHKVQGDAAEGMHTGLNACARCARTIPSGTP